MDKKIQKNKEAFTLIEIMIAITFLVMGVSTSFTLLESSVSEAKENINRDIAINLAQEGMEGVKNIRDTNFKTEIKWNGEGKNNIWEEDMSSCNIGIECCFEIKSFHEDQLVGKPFVLEKLSNCDENNEDIFIYFDEDKKLYTHKSSGNKKTRFKRIVKIKNVEYEEDAGKSEEMLVKTIVVWGKEKNQSITLKTILTNWKI